METGDKMVSFISFLSGFFLVKDNGTYGELSYLINDFTNKYNIYIDDDNDDFSVYNSVFLFNNDGVSLKHDYEASIEVDNNYVKVRNFLYNNTTSEVREYFGIPNKKRFGFLKVKNKTKVS